MPDLGGLPAWAALAIAILGAVNSLRKVKIDERSGVVAELNQLIDTLKEEIDRVNESSKKREAEIQTKVDGLQVDLVNSRMDCLKKIDGLQTRLTEQDETIRRQANQITQLERRRAPRNPTGEAEE